MSIPLPAVDRRTDRPGHSNLRTWYGRAIQAFAILATSGYVIFLVTWLTARDRVIEWISWLDLVEAHRVEAKAGNILFGFTFFFVVAAILYGFGVWYRRVTGISIGFRLLTARPMSNWEPAWLMPVFRGLTISALLIVPLFFLHARLGMKWLFLEDGPVEYLTAAGFFLAGLNLLASGYRNRDFPEPDFDSPNRRADRVVQLTMLAGGALCILVSLEEISWGQRVLGLETPELLTRINTQNELNLHNLFTDYFNRTYFAGGCFFFALNLIALLLRVRFADRTWSWWLPHPGLLVLAALIAAFSFHLESNELVEPVAMLYMVGYSIQVTQANPWRTKRRGEENSPGAGSRAV